MTYIANPGFTYELVLAADVTDSSTVTVAYPTGSSQLSFNAGLAKFGASNVVLNDNDKIVEAASGSRINLTFGASNITLTNNSGATWAAGTKIRGFLAQWPAIPRIVLAFPIDLASVTAADVVTEIRPGVAGYVTYMEFVTGVAVTTGSKLATLNAEIDTTNCTGGTVALTSATLTPKGAVVASAAFTGANRLERTSKFSIEAASVTAFSEGNGTLFVYIQPDAER